MPDTASAIKVSVDATVAEVQKEVVARAYSASNELRNASQHVLRGQRSGRTYRVPGTKKTYQASAPGEAPAVRTGAFRLSWRTGVDAEKKDNALHVQARIESDMTVGKHLLGDVLEQGRKDGSMSARPYKQAVKEMALPKITEIFRRPYTK